MELTPKLTADHEFTVPFNTDAGQTPGGYSEQVPTTLTQGAIGSLPLLANIGAGLDIVSVFISASSLERNSPDSSQDIVVRVSIGGYIAPSLRYQQKNIRTSKLFDSFL